MYSMYLMIYFILILVEVAQSRWKSLRDKYVRTKKTIKGKSGDGASSSQKWILFKNLSFLDNFVKERR